jgi:heptosyltransferase-3
MRQSPPRSHFRDTRHFLLAWISETIAPALRAASRCLSRGAATSPQKWRRVLIVGHGHIGDVLYQTISLGSLTAGLPLCKFDYLTTPAAAEILAGNPEIATVFPWDTNHGLGRLSKGHMEELRSIRYDAVICTHLVRHQEGLLLGLRLGIPNRVAFTHRGLSGLATLPVRLATPMTPALQSRIMARAITGLGDTGELRPCIYLTTEDHAAAALELERLGLSPADTILACSITTRQTVGRVPPEFFARILAIVHEHDPSIRIVLCGSVEDEANILDAASNLGDYVLISCGTMSVRTYAAFMQRCAVFVGMDSGPRHLANAARLPVFFVRNMAVRAAEAAAYCPTETDIAPSGEFLDNRQLVRNLNQVRAMDIAEQIIDAAHRVARP